MWCTQDVNEVVLGDATGVVTLRPREEQVQSCVEGSILRIQNANIRMVANHIRLEVSKWGVLKADEHEDFEPCTSNDISAGGCLPDSEGILQDVSLLGDPSFHPYHSQTGEPKWQARGGLLRLSLEEALPNGPVCVLLHGAIQDSRSATMKDMAKDLAKRGLLTLVMNRRGYGDLAMDAESARVTVFGFDEDLDEVLLMVGQVAPNRPIAVVGFSCGSGFAGSAEVVKLALDPGRGFNEVYRNVTKLAGFGCSNAWVEKQQPDLQEMQVPCLLINSRDDPICIWENVEEHKSAIEKNPFLALAELQRGSHGCKFDFWGYNSVGNRMIGDFVINLMDRELALAANLSYRYPDEPPERLTDLAFEDGPVASPYAVVNAPRRAAASRKQKRSRGRAQSRRSAGSVAAVYAPSTGSVARPER
eukprot:g1394.t1